MFSFFLLTLTFLFVHWNFMIFHGEQCCLQHNTDQNPCECESSFCPGIINIFCCLFFSFFLCVRRKKYYLFMAVNSVDVLYLFPYFFVFCFLFRIQLFMQQWKYIILSFFQLSLSHSSEMNAPIYDGSFFYSYEEFFCVSKIFIRFMHRKFFLSRADVATAGRLFFFTVRKPNVPTKCHWSWNLWKLLLLRVSFPSTVHILPLFSMSHLDSSRE